MEKPPFGILTVAFGPMRYKKQAVALAQSLKLHNPTWPRACVTENVDDPYLSQWFNILIPYRPDYGKGFYQKLYFDQYSPFQKTLYIDSDCLVTRNLDFLVERLEGKYGFTPLVEELATEGWWYMDIAKTVQRMRMAESMPKFNGGVFWFEDTPEGRKVFRKARQLAAVDKRLSILELGDWFNDEPVYGIVLGYLHSPVYVDQDGTGMSTPAHQEDPFDLNVLEGRASYHYKGREFKPTVAHFFGNYTSSYHYLREKYSLQLYFEGVPKWGVSIFRGLGNLAYFAFIKAYQLGQSIKGKKVSLGAGLPLLPLANFGTRFNKEIINKL